MKESLGAPRKFSVMRIAGLLSEWYEWSELEAGAGEESLREQKEEGDMGRGDGSGTAEKALW